MRVGVRCSTVVVVVLLCGLGGCGKGAPADDDPYLGKMGDTSYAGQRTAEGCLQRKNGLGEDVAVTDFEGKFVWAEYSAPWCGPCASQTPVLHNLGGEFGDEVVFLTVMTSASQEYDDGATVRTAHAWAGRFGLDPARVLAADRWAMTVPRHIFLSPRGHTLYVATGLKPEAEIREVLTGRMADWKAWSQTGQRAAWMR